MARETIGMIQRDRPRYVAIFHQKGIDSDGIILLKGRLKEIFDDIELVVIPEASENKLQIMEIK